MRRDQMMVIEKCAASNEVQTTPGRRKRCGLQNPEAEAGNSLGPQKHPASKADCIGYAALIQTSDMRGDLFRCSSLISCRLRRRRLYKPIVTPFFPFFVYCHRE